jgi:hypothetical protein
MQRHAKIVNDWKLEIAENYNEWLDQLEAPPLATSPPKDTPRPDLYSFFEALCVLRSDVSKSSRRSHDTLARFSDSLDGFERTLQEISRRLAVEAPRGRLPLADQRKLLAPFAQILERMDRLADKLADPPKAGLFASRRKWVAGWTAFQQGFNLLHEHFQLVLRDAGVIPMETVGHAFDPTKMKAVAVEEIDTVAHNTVIEELAAGYYFKDEVLKFAEVKIAINKGSHP